MTAVAIYSADSVLRCSLEQLLREDPTMTVVQKKRRALHNGPFAQGFDS